MGAGCSSDTGTAPVSNRPGERPPNRGAPGGRSDAPVEEYLNIVNDVGPEPEPAPEPVPGREDPPSPDPKPDPESEANSGSNPEPQPDSTTEPNPETKPDESPPAPEPEPTRPPAKPTKITKLDMMLDSNKSDHHTSQYEHKGIILRRGQTFELEVGLNKPWDTVDDIIRLQFAMGTRPRVNRRTMFFITPGKQQDLNEACAVLDKVDNTDNGSTLTIRVNLPHDSVIGYFKLLVIVKKKEDVKFTKYNLKEDIVVLFNPWNKGDVVYIKDDDEREEYVMNQNGRLFSGKSTRISSKPWNFGQFEEHVLDVAILLLDSNRSLAWEAYHDPVQITRCISAMVNSSDGSGILTGNWSGNYEGGVSPLKWAGSVAILQKYYKTRQPVKWGQCWVFSGLTTAICRALGIPTRSVTNFASAHDNDHSITIDKIYDINGKLLKHISDSVWNFHVWNEAWFKRNDIPGDYNGWQAFDSTPQERSDGIFRCGPTPVQAIKGGNVHLGYDTTFVFATVNGDRISWVQEPDGTQVPTKKTTNSVGKHISTKKVNSRTGRNDVTDKYKFEEGSKEEREAIKKAYQQSSRRDELKDFYLLDEGYDVDMSFNAKMDQDATARFSFNAKNKASKTRTIVTTFTAVPAYYTGVSGDDLMREVKTLKLNAGQEQEYKFEITAAQWINQLAEDAALGMYVMARVKETKQYFTWIPDDDDEDGLVLDKPEIEMELASTTVKRNDKVDLTMSFANPIDLDLKKCTITVEGPGVQKHIEVPVSNIAARGKMVKTITMTPTIVGKHEVVAIFHSRQLVNITGTVELEIIASSD